MKFNFFIRLFQSWDIEKLKTNICRILFTEEFKFWSLNCGNGNFEFKKTLLLHNSNLIIVFTKNEFLNLIKLKYHNFLHDFPFPPFNDQNYNSSTNKAWKMFWFCISQLWHNLKYSKNWFFYIRKWYFYIRKWYFCFSLNVKTDQIKISFIWMLKISIT